MNELKQYKDMFDCLQEGIIVLEENRKMAGDYDLLFCNEMANRVTKNILKMNIKEKKFDTKLLTSPILFEHKNIQQNKTNFEMTKADALISGNHMNPTFTLNDVVKMSQDQISQIVFSFNKSSHDLNNIFE